MDAHDDELPPNVVPTGAEDAVANEPPPAEPAKPKRLPMARPGLGKKGELIELLANHYKVSVKSSEDNFYHYHVSTYIYATPTSPPSLSTILISCYSLLIRLI